MRGHSPVAVSAGAIRNDGVLNSGTLAILRVDARAAEAIEKVGLVGFSGAYPKELSGGMKQRVGLARALVGHPEMLCLDEPFSALDIMTAEALRSEVYRLWSEGKSGIQSVLLITHFIEEAVFLGDRIVIFDSNPGRIRAIVGPKVPVGAELDLHCHITEAMVRQATVLVAYKEYPHTDIPDRADDLFTLVADAAEGKTRPVMAMHDCRMIGTFRTTEEPMRGYVDRMYGLEGKDGILSVSLGHCFPWGDVADVGVKTLVVADGDQAKAGKLARALGEEMFQLREATRPKFLTMDQALDQALAIEGGPVVIADVSDNSGGGAPGDATFFIRRVRERGIRNVASCYHWDPIAVRFCKEAGLGASFKLRIGGKCGEASGDPLDLFVTVKGLADNVTQRFGKSPVNLGSLAWVSGEGLDIVLATQRSQAFHPEGMTAVGLDPTTRKIVLAKSTQHFHAGFAPIAKAVLYAAPPGALQPDFASIPFTKLTRPYWPRVEDPFKGA